ncbi:hypothetical protein Tco_0148913 [Tanacetum coccineum]
MLSTKPSKTSQGYDHIFWVIVDRLHLSSANLPPMRETDPLDNTCTDAVLKDGVTTAWEYLSLNIRVDRDRDSHQILEVTSEALGTKFGYEYAYIHIRNGPKRVGPFQNSRRICCCACAIDFEGKPVEIVGVRFKPVESEADPISHKGSWKLQDEEVLSSRGSVEGGPIQEEVTHTRPKNAPSYKCCIIHRMVAAIEPKTIQKALQISGALTDEAMRNGSIKKVEKRGNVGEPSKDKNGRDDNKRTRTGNAFATTVSPKPTVRACYECGSTDHVRPACPSWNRAQGPGENRPNQVAASNGGHGRGNQGNQARGRAFMLGAEEAR